MPTCGLTGWKRIGILGKGVRVALQLIQTPCGKNVALKSTHTASMVASHIGVDCAVLERLSHVQNDSSCNHCFPQYYYFSNVTGACYSERIEGVTTNVFLDHVNINSTAGFDIVKDIMRQGLHILSVLARLGIKHRDLIMTNTMIRLPKGDLKDYKLMFIDFGGANVEGVEGVATGGDANRFWNYGQSDTYTFACNFYTYLYNDDRHCKRLPPLDVPDDVSHMGRFLSDWMRATHRHHHRDPDFPDLLRKLDLVSRL
jgi:serine/threonine protein kinase